MSPNYTGCFSVTVLFVGVVLLVLIVVDGLIQFLSR